MSNKLPGRPCDGDKPRKIVVAIRVSDELAQAIDAARLPNESRGQAIRRLLLEHLAITPQ